MYLTGELHFMEAFHSHLLLLYPDKLIVCHLHKVSQALQIYETLLLPTLS